MQLFGIVRILYNSTIINMDKKELVDLCKKRDERALSLLYSTYSNRLMKICLRYIADKQIAQDLLHDGFIIIFTSIDSLRSPEKLESWMGMIMKNLSLKYLNELKANNTIPLTDLEEWEEPIEPLPSDGFPPYNEMLEAIENLPEGYRKVFKLAVLEGLSHKEIGSILNIAPHSSSSQLFRAKGMLRKFINGYGIIIILLLLFALPFGIWINTPKENNTSAETNNSFEKQDADTLTNHPDKPANLAVKPVLSPKHSIHIAQRKDEGDTLKHGSIQNDTTVRFIQIKDSICVAENHKPERKSQKTSHTTDFDYSSRPKGNWNIALSYSGGESHSNNRLSTIPGDVSSGTPVVVEEKVHHYMPVTLSFSLHKKINKRLGIETGLRFTHLRSDFTTISETCTERVQKINYVGIPLKGVMQVWKHGKLSIYTSAGIALDFPIKATSEEVIENGPSPLKKKIDINAPIQWSVNCGAGFQYNITPSVGIYAEPNIHYYFNKGNKWKTIRKEQPVDVTLPIGLRFSW